jgi:hypothetical protein
MSKRKIPEGILKAIYLPATLVERASAKLCEERDISIEDYISVFLRSIIRAKLILKLDDDLPFGKYVGEKVETICKIDPSYISWLISQDGKTKFAPEVLSLVNAMLEIG